MICSLVFFTTLTLQKKTSLAKEAVFQDAVGWSRTFAIELAAQDVNVKLNTIETAGVLASLATRRVSSKGNGLDHVYNLLAIAALVFAPVSNQERLKVDDLGRSQYRAARERRPEDAGCVVNGLSRASLESLHGIDKRGTSLLTLCQGVDRLPDNPRICCSATSALRGHAHLRNLVFE